MRSTRTFAVGAIFGAMLTVPSALVVAAPPPWMTIQGQLTDPSGVPQEGTFTLQFRIFDQASGGAELWPAPLTVIDDFVITTDAEGIWTATVGTDAGLSERVFSAAEAWLEITVDDGSAPLEELSRIKLNTNPYSFRTGSVDGATGGLITGQIEATGLDNRIRFLYQNYSDLPNPSTYHGMFAHVHGENAAYYAHAGGWVRLADSGHTHDGSGIVDDAVNFSEIATDAVRSEEIQVGAVGSSELAINAVGTIHIVNFGVLGEDLANNSVTTDKIANGTILSPDMGPASVVGGVGGTILDGTIVADDLGDEPGVSQSSSALASLPIGLSTISSQSITVPAAGYVIALSTVEVTIDHDLGTTDEVLIDVQSNNVAVQDDISVVIPGTQATGNHIQGIGVHDVYSVGAGLNTFYLLGERISGGAVDVKTQGLTLIYVPTSYGSVTAASASAAAVKQSLPVSNDQVLSRINEFQAELEALKVQIVSAAKSEH